MEGGRNGGREGGREGRREGWRVGGREGWRERGRDGGWEGGREGGREREGIIYTLQYSPNTHKHTHPGPPFTSSLVSSKEFSSNARAAPPHSFTV